MNLSVKGKLTDPSQAGEELYPPLRNRLLTHLLGLFFRLLYHPLAWSYDAVAAIVSIGRWRRWVLQAGRYASGPRILELGFGPGHLQTDLHRQGFQVFGLDESAQMARQARGRLKHYGLSYRLARGLAQRLPYASECFHSVIATFPTNYILDPSTLNEIYRVLAGGGRLVVLFAAWITGRAPIDRAAALLFRATGQTPQMNQNEKRLLDPFLQAGFQTERKELETSDGRLLLIVAVKPVK